MDELKAIYENLGPVANVAMIWVTLQIKREIAEVKVWILENFERRRTPH